MPTSRQTRQTNKSLALQQAEQPRDLGAFLRARLLNHSLARGQIFDDVLTHYALERLMHRLSISIGTHTPVTTMNGDRS